MLARDSTTRVLSVSRKDRGAILPVGRSREQVYWWSNRGFFTTSRYYRDTLPAWVTRWNARNPVRQLAGRTWELLKPSAGYPEPDSLPTEQGPDGRATFPHLLTADIAAADSDVIHFPWMDSLTIDLALTGVATLDLGTRDGHTDLLSMSLSTVDEAGHDYGPDSREMHDMLLRLDGYLGWFLDSLATTVPVANTIFVLAADHGVQPIPEQAPGAPATATVRVWPGSIVRGLARTLRERWRTDFGVRFDYGIVVGRRRGAAGPRRGHRQPEPRPSPASWRRNRTSSGSSRRGRWPSPRRPTARGPVAAHDPGGAGLAGRGDGAPGHLLGHLGGRRGPRHAVALRRRDSHRLLGRRRRAADRHAAGAERGHRPDPGPPPRHPADRAGRRGGVARSDAERRGELSPRCPAIPVPTTRPVAPTERRSRTARPTRSAPASARTGSTRRAGESGARACVAAGAPSWCENSCELHAEPYYPLVCRGFPWIDSETGGPYEFDRTICPEFEQRPELIAIHPYRGRRGGQKGTANGVR